MTATSPNNINALVARYARIGEQRRKKRRLTIASTLAIIPLVAIVGIKGTQYVTSQSQEKSDFAQETNEVRALGEKLRSELDVLATQRIELQQRSNEFELQSVRLITRMGELDEQRVLLEEQAQSFTEQRKLLASAIERANSQRIDIAEQREQYSATTPVIEREIAALNAQRQELQAQQTEFKLQSEQLGNELNEINAQRLELELQQEQLEQQRRTVNEILEQVSALRDRKLEQDNVLDSDAPDIDELVPLNAGHDNRAVAYSAPTKPTLEGIAAVDESALGNMRGGINIGGDMDIAVGLTRTASINGIEEYSSSLHIGDLGSGLSPGELSNVNSVLIQNGAGNVASPAILDALSGNYATTVIQNSLDNQEIATQTVLDISIGNVSSTLRGLAAQQAITDSLSLQR